MLSMPSTRYTPSPIHPIEVSANDQDSFDQWGTARLGRKVHAPDLNASGFYLMGAAGCPHGPAAMFLYDGIHGLRVALVIRPMEVDQTAPMKPFRAEQANGMAWAFRRLERPCSSALLAQHHQYWRRAHAGV